MQADGDREFAEWLLLLGNGNVDRYGDDENTVQVPWRILCRGPLADFLFPEMMNLRNFISYAKKVILCPTNERCPLMNDSIGTSKMSRRRRSPSFFFCDLEGADVQYIIGNIYIIYNRSYLYIQLQFNYN